MEELPNILSAADALLLSQRQSIQNMSLPSKLTSYFLAGVPTVAAVAPEDETAREIEMAGAGILVEPGHPDRLLRSLPRFERTRNVPGELGASARAFAEQHISETSSIGGFEFVLRSCLDGNASRSAGSPQRGAHRGHVAI